MNAKPNLGCVQAHSFVSRAFAFSETLWAVLRISEDLDRRKPFGFVITDGKLFGPALMRFPNTSNTSSPL